MKRALLCTVLLAALVILSRAPRLSPPGSPEKLTQQESDEWRDPEEQAGLGSPPEPALLEIEPFVEPDRRMAGSFPGN